MATDGMATVRRARHLKQLQLKNLYVPSPDPCPAGEEGIKHQHALNFTLEGATSVDSSHTPWQPLYNSEQLLNDLDLTWDPIQLTTDSSNSCDHAAARSHGTGQPSPTQPDIVTAALAPIADCQQLRLTVYFTPIDPHETCSYTTASAACWATASKQCRHQPAWHTHVQTTTASKQHEASASASRGHNIMQHMGTAEEQLSHSPSGTVVTCAADEGAPKESDCQQQVTVHMWTQDDGRVQLEVLPLVNSLSNNTSGRECCHVAAQQQQVQQVHVAMQVLPEDRVSLTVVVSCQDAAAQEMQRSSVGHERRQPVHLRQQECTASHVASDTAQGLQMEDPTDSIINQRVTQLPGQVSKPTRVTRHRKQQRQEHMCNWACRLLQLEFDLTSTLAVDAAALEQAARGVNLVLLHMTDGSVCVPTRVRQVAGVTFLPPPLLLCRVALQPLPEDIAAAARQLTRQVSLGHTATALSRIGGSSSMPLLQAAADLTAASAQPQKLQEQLARWMVDNGSVFAPLGTQNSLDEELTTSGLFDSYDAAAAQQLVSQAADNMPGPVAAGAGFVPALINSLFGQIGSGSTSASSSPTPSRVSMQGNASVLGGAAAGASSARTSNRSVLPPTAPGLSRTLDAGRLAPTNSPSMDPGAVNESNAGTGIPAASPFSVHHASTSMASVRDAVVKAVSAPHVTHRRAASASTLPAGPALKPPPLPSPAVAAAQSRKVSTSGQAQGFSKHPSVPADDWASPAGTVAVQENSTVTRMYSVEDLQSSTRRLMGVHQRLASIRAARQRSKDRIQQLLEQSEHAFKQQVSLQEAQQQLQRLTTRAQDSAAQLTVLQELYDGLHHDLQKRCKEQGVASKALKAAQKRLHCAQETLAGPEGWGLWRSSHAEAAGRANALVTSLAAVYQLGPKGAGLPPLTQSWLPPAGPACYAPSAPGAGGKPGLPRSPAPQPMPPTHSRTTSSEQGTPPAAAAAAAGSRDTLGASRPQDGFGPQRGASVLTRVSNRSGLSSGVLARQRVTPSLEKVLAAQPIDAVMDASWWAAGASDTADSNALSSPSSLDQEYIGESDDGLVNQLDQVIEQALMANTPSVSQPGSGEKTPTSPIAHTPHSRTKSKLGSAGVDLKAASEQLLLESSAGSKPARAAAAAISTAGSAHSPGMLSWFSSTPAQAAGPAINGAVPLCVSGLELPGNLVQRCLEGSAGWGWGTPDEEQRIAAALGYVAHMLDRLSYYLDVPLRYPVLPGMSKSHVCDPAPLTNPIPQQSASLLQRSLGRLVGSTLTGSNGDEPSLVNSQASLTSPAQWLLGSMPIGQLRSSTQQEPTVGGAHRQFQKPPQKTIELRAWLMAASTGKGREGVPGAPPSSAPLVLPLYTDGRDRGKFAYAVYLLNKDVEQLLQAHGLTTSGPNQLLRNLYNLALVAASGIMM